MYTHRDSAWRDPRVAGFFSPTNFRFPAHISQRRTRRSHFADASGESDAHRIRRHSDPGVGIKKTNRSEFGEPRVDCVGVVIGGVVMWIVDAFCNRDRVRAMEEMTLPQAIWIGAAQILSAVFPGASRSMCTIAAGQVAGLTRPAALEFSFFLSMPTMAAATGYDFLKTVRAASSQRCRCEHRAVNDDAITTGSFLRSDSLSRSSSRCWSSPGSCAGCARAALRHSRFIASRSDCFCLCLSRVVPCRNKLQWKRNRFSLTCKAA